MPGKVKSGVLGFDLLVAGGIPSTHSVLLLSPTASESNLFTNLFIKKGLENYEPVLVVLSKISANKFRDNLREIGIDVQDYERRGLLRIVDWYSFKSGEKISDVEERGYVIYSSKDLTNIGIAITRGIKALNDAPVRRAVLDVLPQALNFFEYKRVYNFIQGMLARLRDNNITSIFTMETKAGEKEHLSALQGIFDGVVDIKVDREGEQLIRKIGVLTLSGVEFDSRYRHFRIENNEMIIGDMAHRDELPERELAPEPAPTPPKKPPEKIPPEQEDDLQMAGKLVKAHPKDPNGWFSLGFILIGRKRYEDALFAFDKVIQLNPEHSNVWKFKAEALLGLGRDAEAEECLRKFEDLSTKKPVEKEGYPAVKELESELMGLLEGMEDVEEEIPIAEEFECPLCNAILASDDIRCPNCGVRFTEMEEVPDEVLAKAESTPEVAGPPLKEESFLELEEELEKIAASDEVTEEAALTEEVVFECPNCSADVSEDAESCPNCGAEFVEVSEEPEPEIELEEALEEFECPDCGAICSVDELECPECGMEYEVEEEEVEEEEALPVVGTGLEARPRRFKIEEEPAFGLTNGIRREERGVTNGLTNGLTNGMRRAGGLTNGLTNGVTNGITNGLTNGLRKLRSGITNGITNGNGLTNGLLPHQRIIERKRGVIRIFATVMFFILLFASPFLFTAVQITDNIKIDGSFDDWEGVISVSDSVIGAEFNPNIDIVEYRVDGRQMELSFYLRVNGEMLAGEPDGEKHVDTIYIFIDTDKNPGSGYFIKGIGSDFMVEIFGWNSEVIGSSVFAYSSDIQDWNNWNAIGTIPCAVMGSEIELKVPYNTLYLGKDDVVDVLFYMQSYNGFEDFSDTIISNEEGVLTVTQQGMGDDKINGDGNRLLKLELKSTTADITVSVLRAIRTGNGSDDDISEIRLEDENHQSLGTGSLNNGLATFWPSILISEDQGPVTLYIVVDVNEDARLGHSIGFKVTKNHDIATDQGTVSLTQLKPTDGKNENSYIINVPDNVTIDGAFADWDNKHVRNDTYGDAEREDLDILRYGVSSTDSGSAFFLSVYGEIAAGITVPYRNVRVKPQPITGGEPHDENVTEAVFPPKTGEDIVYIFIDTQSNIGYHANLPIYANYLIEVKGRHNEVLSSFIYKWSGSHAVDWNWTQDGPVDVGLDMFQMEVGILWDAIDVNPEEDNFDVYFLTTDWQKKDKDYSNTEGIIKGPTKGYISEDKTRGYDTKYHGQYDVYFQEEEGQVLFETADGYYLSWNVASQWQIASGGETVNILGNPQNSGFDINELGAEYSYTYDDLDISTEYKFGEDMLKEDIVLGERLPVYADGDNYLMITVSMSYSPGLAMFVDGEEQQDDFIAKNSIEFKSPDGLDTVYTLISPIAVDDSGEKISCEYEIIYDFEKDSTTLSLRCPYEWLDSAVYPVRIDPTVLKNDLYEESGHDDSEWLGYSLAVGDFDDDGVEDDIISGAPYWGNITEGMDRWGAAYIFYGPISIDDSTPDAIINLTDETATRANQDYLGRCVAAGDFDNDGVRDDVVITTLGDEAYVVYGEGGISGVVKTADVIIYPPGGASGFGRYGLAIGNFDGNDGDDVAIGAYSNNSVHIYFNSSDWDDGVVTNPSVTLSDNYYFGVSIATGNLKNNGATDYDDIAVGAYHYPSIGGFPVGGVYVFYGDGTYGDGTENAGADVVIRSGANYPIDYFEYERFGWSLAIGDFNKATTTNDYEDLLVGAYYYNSQVGRAYIYLTEDDSDGGFGSATGEDDDLILEESGTVRYGWSVAQGDFWNDGTQDALVGAYRTSSDSGYAYAYDFGPGFDNSSDWSLAGTNGEGLGYSVAAGDVNGSGFDNFIVGCPYYYDYEDEHENDNAGRILVDEYIPEFRDILLPVGIVLTLFVIRKKRYSKKNYD